MKLSKFIDEMKKVEKQYGGDVEVMVLYRNAKRDFDGFDEPICFMSEPREGHEMEDDYIYIL